MLVNFKALMNVFAKPGKGRHIMENQPGLSVIMVLPSVNRGSLLCMASME